MLFCSCVSYRIAFVLEANEQKRMNESITCIVGELLQ